MCSKRQGEHRAAAPVRGLSIVELMVGLVVALLVSLVVVNSAISFTASQRQGIGATGAGVGSANIMSTLKDDVAVAGLGFFGDSVYLCESLNFSDGANVLFNGAPFSPLQVQRTAAGDQIDIVFGTRVESGANVRLRAASDGSSSALESFLPVAVGEAVLLAPAAPGAARPCLVRTVTRVTNATPTSAQILDFGTAGRHNSAAFGTAPSFDDDARIAQLGAVNWVRYRVDGGNLLLERPIEGTSVIVARNVISFRMQFGVSGNPPVIPGAPVPTTLANWTSPVGGFATVTGSNLPLIRAVRIGLIVRSPQPEKPDANGKCFATADKPVLWDNLPDNLNNADWQCWRYRTSTVVVPLRNVVLGLQ